MQSVGWAASMLSFHKLEHDFNHHGNTFPSSAHWAEFTAVLWTMRNAPFGAEKSILRRKQQQNFWANCTGRNCVSLDGRRHEGAKYNVFWSKRLTGTNRHCLLSFSDTPAARRWADVSRAEQQSSSKTRFLGLQPKTLHLRAQAFKFVLLNVPVCQNNHPWWKGVAIYILNLKTSVITLENIF